VVSVWKVCRQFGGSYWSYVCHPQVEMEYVLGEERIPPFGPSCAFDSLANAKRFLARPEVPRRNNYAILLCDAKDAEPALGMSTLICADWVGSWWRGQYLDECNGEPPPGTVWAYGLVPRKEVARQVNVENW